MKHPIERTNGHVHVKLDLPDEFPNKLMYKLVNGNKSSKVVGAILQNINPFSDTDKYHKLWLMAEASKVGSMEDMFLKMLKEGDYSERTRFWALTVDMSHMGAGKTQRTFGESCLEIEMLRQKYPNQIVPFLHMDYRDPNMYALFNNFVYNGAWGGVKMYNSMGTKPQSIHYEPAYQMLIEVNKPIISHCTYSNPVHFMGTKKELKEILGDWYDDKLSRSANCDKLTNPLNWLEVCNRFWGLKVILAHGGGQKAWLDWKKNTSDTNNLLNIILYCMRENPYIYMDISFTINNKETWSVLKYIMSRPEYAYAHDRIIWGTDYYMNISEITESVLNMDFESYIGIDIYNKIARENPNKLIKL